MIDNLLGIKTATNEANKAFNTVSTEIVQTIEFPFLPPTLNELLSAGKSKFAGSGRGKLARLKKEWNSKALLQISRQAIKPIEGKVWIELIWFTSFRRDHDNTVAGLKSIFDALVLSGVLKNDNLETIQSPVSHWHERTPKGEADCVIMTISNTPRHNLERYSRYLSLIADALDRF